MCKPEVTGVSVPATEHSVMYAGAEITEAVICQCMQIWGEDAPPLLGEIYDVVV